MDIFKSVIIQSSKNEIFQKDLLVTQKLINRANKLPLNKIKEIEPHKFVYIHQNGKTLPGLIHLKTLTIRNRHSKIKESKKK